MEVEVQVPHLASVTMGMGALTAQWDFCLSFSLSLDAIMFPLDDGESPQSSLGLLCPISLEGMPPSCMWAEGLAHHIVSIDTEGGGVFITTQWEYQLLTCSSLVPLRLGVLGNLIKVRG